MINSDTIKYHNGKDVSKTGGQRKQRGREGMKTKSRNPTQFAHSTIAMISVIISVCLCVQFLIYKPLMSLR